VDIELSRPIDSIEGLNDYSHLLGLVRIHGTPIGYIKMSVNDGCLRGESLLRTTIDNHGEAIARHLLSDSLTNGIRRVEFDLEDLVKVAHPVYSGPLPTVTVAVCTRDRTADLKRCLDSLALVNYPGLEILVVDNAPDDDSTDRLVHKYGYIRYVRESRPGLDWARNRAILEARGEIIAYTDDDVVVDHSWVLTLAAVFVEEPDAMVVTGLVVPYDLETEAQVLFEWYGGFGLGFRRKWYRAGYKKNSQIARLHGGVGKVGSGANMAFRREVFNHVGFFNTALDMGTPTNGGGDHDMMFRVIKHGYTLVYEPSAMVRHVHRRNAEALRNQICSWGTGFASYVISSTLSDPYGALGFIKVAFRCLWERSVRPFAISLLRPSLCSRTLVLAETWGLLVGVFRYFRACSISKKVKQKFGCLPVVELRARRHYKSQVLKRQHDFAVRTIDIYQAPKALSDVADYPLTRVVVTRGHHSVGRVAIANEHGRVSATRVCDAIVHEFGLNLLTQSENSCLSHMTAKTLTLLRRHYDEVNGRSKSEISERLSVEIVVSVVVATYDRPDQLRRCLRSLSGQQTSRFLEIIVVDNHPSSHLTSAVVAEFPKVILVNEPRRGLSYARNRGIVASKGEIIVATDDDVSMPSDWLEKLVAPFVRNDVMIVTGNVLPSELDTPAQKLFELYGGLQRGFRRWEADFDWFQSFKRRACPIWELGSTANAAFRASLFSAPQVGLFDEALGAGTSTGCSEDTYLFYKALKAGYTVVYEPEAYVWHQHHRNIPPLRKQIYAYSKGHVAYNLTTFFRDHDRRALFRLIIDLPAWHLRNIKRWVCGMRNYPLSLIIVEIVGNLVGAFALWRSRRRVKREGHSKPYLPKSVCESDLFYSERATQSVVSHSCGP